MASISTLLDHPALYRLWQAPFVGKKLAPVMAVIGVDPPSKVLDVGCGPGTNTATFASSPGYVGVDLSEKYIEYARRRYGRDFRVADVTEGLQAGETFDLILLNSLMHHIDDEGAVKLLQSLSDLLAPNGVVHILDLVLPDKGLSRRLALADRGEFPRPLESWTDLVGGVLTFESVDQFGVGLAGLTMWTMVHIVAVGSGGAAR